MPDEPTGGARPNIVFLFSDQQRWDTVGACGSPLGVTPHLDRLAADGVAFTQCFTPQPVCGPARASLQTGLWATQTGVWRNGLPLRLDAVTLPRVLGPAGYDLAYIGKWHLATDDGFGDPPREPKDFTMMPVPPERRGGWDGHWVVADTLEHTSHGYGGHMFDAAGKRVDWEGYRVDALTNFALEYLGGRGAEGPPFFLFVSYLEPHHQNDRDRVEGPEGSAERFANAWVPEDILRAEDPGDWRAQWPDYVGCVASLDENVGRIVAALDRRGLRENTLIIYASDHGCHFATRNWEYKRSCHDASIRVPCVVNGSGFRGGATRNELVNLLDLSATIVRAAGVDVPDPWAGRPLQDLMAGGTDWRGEAFVQISEAECGRALRTERWTYAVRDPEDAAGFLDPASPHYAEAFLYDNDADPHQLRNLVADPAHADVREQLRTRLLAHIARIEHTTPEIAPV